MSTKYPHVYQPFIIRGVLFKNRLAQAPPGCFFAADENGYVTDEFVNYYRQYARGGVAINTVGNCTIDVTESSDEDGQLQLSNPGCVQPLKYFAEMCKGYGAHGSLEITHNGKDTMFERVGHAPYSVSSFIDDWEIWRAKRMGRDPIPTIEMSKEKIRETVEKFATAAMYCKQAGMKICMIHGAHGNLIAQFASPKFNKRTDEYGGSLENRARFACEILDAVRARVGEDFVIEYRISGDEMREGHMRLPETIEFIKYIKDKVDILHVSAGLHDFVDHMRWLLQNYTMDQCVLVHMAAAIKKAYPELMIATVGSIKNVAMAEEIIASGKADIVAMNRALHADFEMPRKFAEGREWEHMPCLRCRCFRMASPHTTRLCSVNPIWGRYMEYPEGRLLPAANKKKVAVVGGGPSGVEAVKWLLQRGHDVTLYEKSDKFGGRLWDGIALPFKKDLRDYLGYLQEYPKHCGARVFMNTEATKEMLDKEKYDAILVAIGSDPIIPAIPGAEKPHAHWAPDAETGEIDVGENVVVIGGAIVGTEVAIYLGMHGKKVTIVEMAEEVDLMSTGGGGILLEMLDEYGIERYMGWKTLEVTDDSVVAENNATGEKRTFAADTVLFATGMRSRREEALKFYHCCPETNFFIIGDCAEVSDIRGAVWTAFEAARYI